eukprot:12411507-Karenia_brevis.AAC.1
MQLELEKQRAMLRNLADVDSRRGMKSTASSSAGIPNLEKMAQDWNVAESAGSSDSEESESSSDGLRHLHRPGRSARR